MTPTDLETLRGQINLRFQSGNSIQVSDVRLARAEWEALTALLAEYERMRLALEFYADPENWRPDFNIEECGGAPVHYETAARIYVDGGDVAKDALRATLKESEHE